MRETTGVIAKEATLPCPIIVKAETDTGGVSHLHHVYHYDEEDPTRLQHIS